MHINENVVDVNYEISITDKETDTNKITKETHSMRYFFIKELTFYLEHIGFSMLNYYEWMTLKEPNTHSWNVVIIAKK